jgi:hypothetical protein
MSPSDDFMPFPACYRGKQLKPTVVLLSSLVLSLVWWYFGRFPFYEKHLAARLALFGDPAATAAIYTFGGCFLLLGVVPALVVKFVFRERLADYGVQLGNRRRTFGSLVILAPLFVLVGYLGSRQTGVSEIYPLNRSAGSSPGMFAFHACIYMLLFAGMEFHYRGFVQFGLRESFGEINAFWVQLVMSVLILASKPAGEAFGAIWCGMLWGLLAFRNRSLLSGLAQRFAMGISLDFFICYGSRLT